MQTIGDVVGDITKLARDPESNLSWAQGCESCKCGIVIAPELTGAVALYAERLVHAVDRDVTFCTCKAGLLARQHMLRLYRERQAEAQQPGTAAALGGFDEVVWARQKIHAAYEMMATQEPTVNGERVTA
jgi:hypothetical protein